MQWLQWFMTKCLDSAAAVSWGLPLASFHLRLIFFLLDLQHLPHLIGYLTICRYVAKFSLCLSEWGTAKLGAVLSLLFWDDFKETFGKIDLILNGSSNYLGVLLESRFLHERQVAVIAKRPLLNYVLYTSCMPSPVEKPLVLSLIPWSFPVWTTAICCACGCSCWRIWQHVQFWVSLRVAYVTPLSCELHRVPVYLWVQFKLLVIVFKVLQSMGPGSLRNHLVSIILTQPTWLVEEIYCGTCWLKNFDWWGLWIYFGVCPALWNILPPDVKWDLTLLTFQKGIKTCFVNWHVVSRVTCNHGIDCVWGLSLHLFFYFFTFVLILFFKLWF